MRAGLIVEGAGDHAVITNILKGALDLQQNDIDYLRPRLARDETDNHAMAPDQYGNYALVIEECKKRIKLDAFLNIEGNDILVIHLDLAEYSNYELSLPPDFDKQNQITQSKIVHGLLVNQIDLWTGGKYRDYLCHALAAQETEAWLLAIHEEHSLDTAEQRDPKKRFREIIAGRVLKKKEQRALASLGELERNARLTKAFRRKKTLLQSAERNFSLKFFCDELGRRGAATAPPPHQNSADAGHASKPEPLSK